jgi:hypothetical protein
MAMIRSYERAMTNNERSGAVLVVGVVHVNVVWYPTRELKSLKKINASRSEG